MGQALTFFPTPADDETIYSVCSRFHQVAGRLNSGCSSALLLGHPNGGAEIDLVGGLLHLEAASEGAITANEAMCLYRAMEQFVALGDCARHCALGLPEIQRWLRRDASLVEHRKAAQFQIKHRAAVQSVEGARLHNPDLTRVGVLRRVNWAFRWLEQHDPELLNQLAPAPYGRQRALFEISTTSRLSAVGR